MNIDKRYCQNRIRKRKKLLKDSPFQINDENSVEGGRQFKLNRFVKDIKTFVEEKERVSKKVKSSFFHSGIQTKFCTRGTVGKDVTAKLDEKLQQIIALTNKESNCPCSHYCRCHKHEPAVSSPTGLCSEPLLPLNSRASLNTLNVQDFETLQCGNLKDTGVDNLNTIAHRATFVETFDKLDYKLYPEFTRIITITCTESKYSHFKEKSYVSAVKKKLLDLYLQGKKENSEEFSCPSDIQKSSVATSPLVPFENNSLRMEPQSDCVSSSSCESAKEPTFNHINFVPEPLKSTKQFLEETIGPTSSSYNTTNVSSGVDQICSETSLSPVGSCSNNHQAFVSRMSNNIYKPLSHYTSPESPTSNFTSIIFGERSDHKLNKINFFLPPLEEDSPEFKYFPRRMF